MESSDEEGEIVPGCTDYHFVDHNNELVSLDALPLRWSHWEPICNSENRYFLIATAEDDSLQKIHKEITAWKYDLSFFQPEVSVLSKDAKWIILQKPRKSFEGSMRTLLVTIHWLHFLKKNPKASAKDLWSYLLKIFSSFDVEPSEKDLYVHKGLIAEALKWDKDLAKFEYLDLLDLLARPREDADSNEDKMEDDFSDKDIGEFLDADEGSYDPVCALCDNGGETLRCQGKWMRSFHDTISAGNGGCDSLGYQEAQVNAIPTFLCLNCKYRKHQCFVCGTLGSSDSSSGAVVFPCISATCGHFYHADCAANLLEPVNTIRAKELQDMISSGESFTCPVHKCLQMITDGKVEGSVMAIRRAVKMLDEGCSVQRTKAVCGPEIISQVTNWKMKLQIYLAPFFHGMRYTSYGRHFTKVVNRLHHYVNHGDTIVDFCCGSNDFSIMMKEKLDQTGKHCWFNNFDLIRPKNDFCFEQRDWMDVKLEELPCGSRLIVGLKPPFGVANMFITKALKFKPKVLILIVPEGTGRPDQMGYPYDLIWEEREIQSFYPWVSHIKPEDWNLRPPILYLWSRRDWIVMHREIYIKHIQSMPTNY